MWARPWNGSSCRMVCLEITPLLCPGFRGAILATTKGNGDYNQTIVLDQVRCLGDEPALSLCANLGYGVNDCGHYEDAGVICDCEWCGRMCAGGIQP